MENMKTISEIKSPLAGFVRVDAAYDPTMGKINRHGRLFISLRLQQAMDLNPVGVFYNVFYSKDTKTVAFQFSETPTPGSYKVAKKQNAGFELHVMRLFKELGIQFTTGLCDLRWESGANILFADVSEIVVDSDKGTIDVES